MPEEVQVGVLDKFEKGVERVVSGAFAKAFRSEVKPVEIASAIRRVMDERAAAVTRERTVVPNDFRVSLSEPDLAQVQTWGEEALAEEMVTTATEHASRQRYTFVGPVSVVFEEDPELTQGRFTVRSETIRGAAAPATVAAPSRQHPILDIDGQRYLLTGPVTVLGRGSDSDIVVDDPGVSRRHLEIRVTPEGVIATDLGSTNGTYVEGHSITAATLVDGNTLTIGRTRILFWTGADESDDVG